MVRLYSEDAVLVVVQLNPGVPNAQNLMLSAFLQVMQVECLLGGGCSTELNISEWIPEEKCRFCFA